MPATITTRGGKVFEYGEDAYSMWASREWLAIERKDGAILGMHMMKNVDRYEFRGPTVKPPRRQKVRRR